MERGYFPWISQDLCVTKSAYDDSFRCGACNKTFDRLCMLHCHLVSHEIGGGSYVYNQGTRTAYPKFDGVCASSQTDPDQVPVVNDSISDQVSKQVNTLSENLTVENKIIDDPDLSGILAAYRENQKIFDNYFTNKQGFLDVNQKIEKEIKMKLDHMKTLQKKLKRKFVFKPLKRVRKPRKRKVPRKAYEEGLNHDEPPSLTSSGKCNKCDKLVPDGNMDTHMCPNVKPIYKCEICEKTYFSESYYHFHTLTHTDTKNGYRCEVCGKMFFAINEHRKICGIPLEKRVKFQCNICGAHLSSSDSLRSHMRHSHSDLKTKKTVCEICGKSFRKIKRHMATHDEFRERLKCDVCNETFSCQSSLGRHKKLHTSTPSHQCLVCGKLFNSSWNLKVHSRQHTTEKPYVCDICGQAFTHNVSRKAHMAKHMSTGISTAATATTCSMTNMTNMSGMSSMNSLYPPQF